MDCEKNGADCTLNITMAEGNDTFLNCENGTASTSVIELQAFCDFEPIARRDLYLSGDECFLMGNVTDNGTLTRLYGQFGCDGTSFVTTLYEEDDECSDESQVAERYIAAEQCAVWLFDGNETDFGFDIMAQVWSRSVSLLQVASCDDSGGNIPFGLDTMSSTQLNSTQSVIL